MSKCDIQITFDNSDRMYRGGEEVSGQVHVRVNEDIRCNGIILTHFWKTHGRGNTDRGERQELRLSEMVPLQAGEELQLPFSFVSPRWPLTYHGHYINLDHYVHVAVDVSWAIDPKHEEEYILVAGERPPEITGERGEVVKFEKAATEVSGIGKMILFGVAAIFIVLFSALFVFLIPVFLIAGGGYLVWRKMIASRVGEVELKIPHVVVGPGEPWPVELTFTPQKTFFVNGINLKLTAQESATSGSGTDATTYHHTLVDETHTLLPAGQLMAGEQFSERFVIEFPQSAAWSLNASDNDIKWWAEVRIDIPRFPDWSKKTELQFVPAEFLDTDDSAAIQQLKPMPTGDARSKVDSELTAEFSDGPAAALPVFEADTDDGDVGEDVTPLLSLIRDIKQAGRFGNERSEIVRAAEGHTYDVAVSISRVSPTFGFSGDDECYENGKTIVGTLVGTDQEVQLFTVGASNGAVENISRGETWETLAVVQGWDSLYDRLVMYEVPFDE